jgi:phosphoserine phosphatase
MIELVATLVSKREAKALTESLLAKLAPIVPQPVRVVQLERHIAADLIFPSEEGASVGLIEAGLRQALGNEPVDVIIQPSLRRQKRFDELADFAGFRGQVSEITERAMRGELSFEPALRERVRLLKGLDVEIVSRVITERITQTPGGRTLVMTMRAKGAYTALVSGGFTVFTEPLSLSIGFNEHRSNTLEIEAGLLTGEVRPPILGREAKRNALIELRDLFSLAPIDTLALGDGANDLAMIQEAGLGVAWQAKPAVAEAAHARLHHSDLTALLYAQGYPRRTWVE